MTRKLPSTKLVNFFEQINSTFGQAKKLVLEAYNLAIQEKYKPQGAKHLLLDNITVFKQHLNPLIRADSLRGGLWK